MTESSDAYPYRFERTSSVGRLRERFSELAAGVESGAAASIAGRLRTVRTHGKLAFADLEDASGRIQLFAQRDILGEEAMEDFARLSVGDVVGAEGEVVTTRRGELSLKVARVTVLAPCLRSMPEKWHGMTEIESRYRQRYLDLLVNPAAREVVTGRAAANGAARRMLEERGFIEVETPILHPLAGGAVARPFKTHHNALDMDLFLRIAPELYLKRLLIGGLERVYELNRSFRNEGVSSRHNPEYTMLEAYEAYADYQDTMSLVEDLVRAIAAAVTGSLQPTRLGETIDLEATFRRITMFEAVEEAAGVDLRPAWDARDDDRLRASAGELGVDLHPAWARGKVMAEIFESCAERTLLQPTFVAGFPVEVSPLAKAHRSIEGFTEHADLVIAGVEMCPCYSELNDPAEQRRRFEQQAQARSQGDEEASLPDEDFLEALSYGMPPAGGFGLGVDRLLSFLLGASSIREVILFPTLRPSAPGGG
ncbi:MAG: lysine--tRNA ligase [Actinobacteria bacterium]|nr:lysine--tRNA ligase [Actinomycetota bacterium]MDQ3219086.1 lysine--tRNA ligase [Actinomycetota bacterium]